MKKRVKPRIPNNSSPPQIRNLKDYFRYRRRLERITRFYRKAPLNTLDEQGLPNVRREILRSSY